MDSRSHLCRDWTGMKIEWNENPLRTKVIVSMAEAEAIVLKRKTRSMLVHIKWAKIYLEKGDAKKAEEYLDSMLDGEDRESVYDSAPVYKDALLDTHIGDCTCVPCTCMKCLAEDALGIDTIAGLGKHEAHAIACAFGDWMVDDGGAVSIDVALERLKNYEPEEDDLKDFPDREVHLERWRQEHRDAHDWLLNYKAEHHF